MNVYWLEQAAEDVPSDPAWLTAMERTHLRSIRFAKRRADWLLGRWTAKNALAIYSSVSTDLRALADFEIRPQPSGAPQAFCEAEPMPLSISLSHRAGLAMCVVAAPAAVRLGCDLEIAEPHSDSFLADYFTATEQRMVLETNPADRVWLLSLLWSAKESALKVLGEGLRLDTRDLTVLFPETAQSNKDDRLQNACSIPADPPGGSFWNPIQVHNNDAQIFDGWWNRAGARLRTVVATPVPAPPTFL